MDEKQLKALYDAMQGKLGLGTFDQFKSSIYSDSNFRKAFHTEASHDLEIGDYASFDNSLKKKANGISSLMQGAGSALGNGLSQSNGRVSEKQKVLDYMQGLKEKQPITNIPQSAIENQILPTKKKSRITDKEAEDEAIRRFNSPLSIHENIKGYQAGAGMNVPMNEDDPIGNRLSEIENEKNATINSYDPLSEKPDNEIYHLNEIDVKNKQAQLIKDYSIQDSNEAAYIVKKLADKNNGGDIGSLNNYSLEQIKAALPENNVTAKLAFDRYSGKRLWDDADRQYQTFDEMAAKMYDGRDLKDISESKAGNLIKEAFDNPYVQEKAKESAEFANKLRQAEFDWWQKYPSSAFKRVSELIGQKGEDEGLFGSFYANPNLKKVSTVIEKLKEEGKWGAQEDRVFKEKMLADVAAGNADKVITTEDVLHRLGRGIYHGLGNIESSARTFINRWVTGGFLDPKGNGLFQNLGLVESNQDRVKRLEQEESATATVEPKRFGTKIFGGAAEFTGEMSPMLAGGAMGLPEAMTMTAMFMGGNNDNAIKYFPNDVGLQNLYTTIGTTFDVLGMKYLPTKKAAEGFKKLINGEIIDVVKKLSNKEITLDVAKKGLLDRFTNYLGRVGKLNTQTATVLGAYKTGHDLLDAGFGQKDITLGGEVDDFVNDFGTNWLNSSFISGLGAFKGGEHSFAGKQYIKIAENADANREIIQNSKLSSEDKQDYLDKIDLLSQTNEILSNRGIKREQREKYLTASIKKFVSDNEAAKIRDKTLAKDEERKAKIAGIEKEHILNPMSNTTLVENLYEHLPKGSQQKLTTDEKFDKQKVTPYLEYIAQQSNGLDENWKPHEDGRIPRMADIPNSIKEAANEKFAKEIESSQEPIKEETGTASTVSGVEGGDVYGNAMKQFEDAGFKVSRGSVSETDYGKSSYFYIERPDGTQQKIRVSDHSVTNKNRMVDEVHIFNEKEIPKAIESAKQKIDNYTKNEKVRDEIFAKDKSRTEDANKKWDEIKADFKGQEFSTNDRTYDDLETFKKKNPRAKNIIQTPLDKGAFSYEYSYDKIPNEFGKQKPSRNYIENYTSKPQSTKVEEQDGGKQPVEVYKDVPIYKDKDGNYFVEDKKGNKSTFAVMDGAMGVKKAIDTGVGNFKKVSENENTTNQEHETKIQELEAERQGKVNEAMKPELKLDLLPEVQVEKLKAKDRITHDDIEDRMTALKKLIECLWKKK